MLVGISPFAVQPLGILVVIFAATRTIFHGDFEPFLEPPTSVALRLRPGVTRALNFPVIIGLFHSEAEHFVEALALLHVPSPEP